MGESAYVYWSFLGELNHALFDDGEVTFLSARVGGQVRFAFILFEYRLDVQKKLSDPLFVLNSSIAREVYDLDARNDILKRCGSMSEPTFSASDYELKAHTDPVAFCEELKLFAERDTL